MKKIFPTLLIPFYLLLFPYHVSAETLRISPAILKIELSPGKTTEQLITVENILDAPLPLKITVEGFDSSDEENGIKITNEVITSPLTNWIKLDTEDAIIPAKSSQTFTATITVPPEVALGGYYAVIFFSPVLSQQDINTNNQIGAKIGALALANIGVTAEKNEGKILNFDFNKSFYQKESPKILLRTQNTSLNFFTAQPTIKIKPIFGKEEVFAWEEKTILPGKIRRWEKEVKLNNHYGVLYKTTLSVSLENGAYITTSKYFWSFPLNQAALILFASVSLLYSLFHFKRVSKAVKLLFKPD